VLRGTWSSLAASWASAYYERAKGNRSARAISDERLLAEIKRVHSDNYEAYGSRRTWKELSRQGIECARCAVERLMRRNGIQGAKRRGKPWRTTTPDPEGRRKPDLVDRDFTAEAPNRLWVADFTHLRTLGRGGLLQLRDRRLLPQGRRLAAGHQHAHRPRPRRACGSPTDNPVLRGPVESGQYTSAQFTQELDDNDVLGSLGSTGDAFDNALAESFVDSFKTELIADRTWRSVEQAELAIVEWVSWFNHDRLHSSIGDIPPVEFEQAYRERVEAAPPPGSSRLTGSLRRAAGEHPEPLPDSVMLQDTETT